MKNALSHGQVLTLIAPVGGVTGGVPLVMGALLVVPNTSAGQGVEFSAVYQGEFALVKAAADTPTLLAPAYWNDTDKIISSEVKFTPPASSEIDLPKVGFFSVAGLADDTTVAVVLTGIVQS